MGRLAPPWRAWAQEIQEQLNKLLAGDVSLVSELGAIRLALQAAIADAFQTPEVIRLFAKREPGALRERLAAVDQDYKLAKVPFDKYKCVARRCGAGARGTAAPDPPPPLPRAQEADD